MKPLRLLLLPGLMLGLLAASPQADAIALPLDGTWSLVDEESDAEDGFRFGSPWSIESEHPVELCLADIYVPGEVYEVYANGLLLGTTGEFESMFSGDWTNDPERAKVLGSFSHGCWLLEPGEYSIDVLTIKRPQGEAFRASKASVAISARQIPRPVPEGGSGIVLLGLGLCGVMVCHGKRAGGRSGG